MMTFGVFLSYQQIYEEQRGQEHQGRPERVRHETGSGRSREDAAGIVQLEIPAAPYANPSSSTN